MDGASKCPFAGASQRHTAAGAFSNATWWPEQLNLQMLHQHSDLSSPMDKSFDYAEAFNALDYEAVKRDLT